METRFTIKSLSQDLVYLVQGKDRLGREAFYYVLVDRLKRDIFLREGEKGISFDLRKFGEILISGFGYEPTQDAKVYLKNEYNVTVD